MIDFSDFKSCEQVFRFFEEISSIPRGSGNCRGIADHLVRFAIDRELEYILDEADNVIIKKPATSGYESRPTVIIQGHTDIVAEKLPGLDIDMRTEGLKLMRDGDHLYAEGTTLGADNGIAVAYMMALLDSKSIPHPAIEAVFTSDEEIGLIGAGKLDPSALSGRILINVDSEEEGIFTVGCAGGVRTDMNFEVKREASPLPSYLLSVADLHGGHSGIEIANGRENAIKLGIEILASMPDIRLVSFEGGKMDNAIPRAFSAVFASEADPRADFEKASAEILSRIKDIEPNAKISLSSAAPSADALSKEDTARIIGALSDTRSGVIKMSEDIKGLPESSENIGVAELSGSSARVTVSVRSGKREGKATLVKSLSDIAEKYSARFSTRGDYPAWEYKSESPLRDTAVRVYKKLFGKDPEVVIIHAGLECGLFADKLDGLDSISVGPNMSGIHTTEERLSLSSSERVWEFLLEVLKEI
ncbi:MAG: aminoacyl-histidine dipeptidase [Clostridia bacterium]|nr:aminoacyl-histidine dipeptidase [Clostridia bacterium]